jgi:hypothetical protein
VAAIDYSDADAHERALNEPLNVAINALIEPAAQVELPRGFLGASIVGHHCLRQIQFDWWCKPLLADRVRLIFDRGHFFEAEARKRLIAAGFMFAPREALEFVALDGYLQGHADGIVTTGPAMPGVYLPLPCVWECKALNTKNFRAVACNGIGKVFPRYVVQVRLYQHFLNVVNPALFTCVNADSCELLHFTLPYDAASTDSWIGRAAEVIAATRQGE